MDYGVYRTAHSAFPETVEGEYTALVLPPEAELAVMAPLVQNALAFRQTDALHLLHLRRMYELLPDKAYRGGQFFTVLDGAVAPVSDRCLYCTEFNRMFADACEPCRPELAEKYSRRTYGISALIAALERGGGRKLMPILLHRDDTYVRLHAEDIAEGRLRGWSEAPQGYRPLSLTFDRDIIRRNELIFNAEMAERTGKMQALKFSDDQ